MECRHCSISIPDDSAFCPECGRSVETPVPARAAASRPAAAARTPADTGTRETAASSPPASPPAPWAAPASAPRAAPAEGTSRRASLVIAVIVVLIAATALVVWLASGDESAGDDDGPVDGGGAGEYELVAEFSTIEPAGGTFEAAAGDWITVFAGAVDAHADPYAHLWGPGGDYWWNDDSAGTLDSFISVEAPASGTYEYRVEPLEGSEPGQMYVLVERNP